jgi:hypothetical protein
MNEVLLRINKQALLFVKSKRFFYLICIVFSLQAFWYALSFQPIIFDEGHHFGFISRYTHQISPFILHQSPGWDALGEVTRDPSYLFYYLMSWPLRLIQIFTGSAYVQILLLRALCIIMAVTGLFFYRKAFLLAKIPPAIVNVGMLFFILLPTVALYPGAIHYDNAIFLIYGIALWLITKYVSVRAIDTRLLLWFMIIGALGSLIKFQFIALFLPIVLYLIWFTFRRQNYRQAASDIVRSYKQIRLAPRIALSTLAVLSLGLFIERPVTNVIVYGQIQPDCQRVISAQRCLLNFTTNRNLLLLENKSKSFSPEDPFDFMLKAFVPAMLTSQAVPQAGKPHVKLLVLLIYTSFFVGMICSLIYLRELVRSKAFGMFYFLTAAYSILLSAYLYTEYLKYGSVVATSGRYLYQVLPLIIVIGMMSVYKIRFVRRHGVVFAAVFLIVLSQGGGILTYLTSSGTDFYWKQSYVRPMNDVLGRIGNKIIIDKFR